MLTKLPRKLTVVGLLALTLSLGLPCRAQEATFDDMSPGIYGTSLADGGLDFYNATSLNGPTGFDVDDFSGNSAVTSLPGYSPPNMMTVGAYTSGDLGAGGAFQSFYFELSSDGINATTCNSASIAVFAFNPSPGGIITLEGLTSGSVTASSSFDVPGVVPSEDTLSVSGGSFDSFAVVSSGSFNQGYSLADFDSVILTVPEPASLGLVGLSALILRRRPARRETKRRRDYLPRNCSDHRRNLETTCLS